MGYKIIKIKIKIGTEILWDTLKFKRSAHVNYKLRKYRKATST